MHTVYFFTYIYIIYIYEKQHGKVGFDTHVVCEFEGIWPIHALVKPTTSPRSNPLNSRHMDPKSGEKKTTWDVKKITCKFHQNLFSISTWWCPWISGCHQPVVPVQKRQVQIQATAPVVVLMRYDDLPTKAVYPLGRMGWGSYGKLRVFFPNAISPQKKAGLI